MRMGKAFGLLCVLVCASAGVQVASAEVIVRNLNGEVVGELASVWDGVGGSEYPHFWVVYNDTLQRLVMLNATAGATESRPEMCPYFMDAGCTGQVYLNAIWVGWVVRCGDRHFQANDTVISLDGSQTRLNSNGSCDSPTGLGFLAVEAVEIQEADLPFDLWAGPLQLETSTVQQQAVAVDAVGFGGQLAIVLIIVGAGVLLIRKFS
jgi:hypothetical protein